ncbi:MAG: hypothetical protein NY202_00775 [Mollicutes bacterium UO1]
MEKTYIIRRYQGQGSEIIYACSTCYKNSEQEYLQNYESIFFFPSNDRSILEVVKRGKSDCYSGKKDRNGKVLKQKECRHCQPWKKQAVSNLNDKEIAKILLRYFQQHNIKKIKLVNGKLVIEYNDKETKKSQVNNQELQLVNSIIQESNKQELTTEILNSMVNANSNLTTKPKDNNALFLIGGGIGIVLKIVLMTCLVVKKRKGKK